MAAFAALSLAVLIGKPFGVIDHRAQSISNSYFTGYRAFLRHYVLLGQRGPTVKAAAVYFVVLSLWRRTADSMLLFALAELGNNLLVGLVKVGTGRWGPKATVNAHDIFAGGDIFPSGHVSNAVVLFGVLALTAHQARRPLWALAAWVSASVGIATVLLDTHWVTDVLGGWLAGSIVLLCLPAHEGLTRLLLAGPARAIRALWRSGRHEPKPADVAASPGRRQPSRAAGARRGQPSTGARPGAVRDRRLARGRHPLASPALHRSVRPDRVAHVGRTRISSGRPNGRRA